MAFSHGSKAVIKFGTQASPTVVTDISAYCNSVSAPYGADTAETTVFGKTAKTYIPGLSDGTISIEGKFDPTVDAQLAAIVGLQVNFEYGPVGSAVTSPKYTGACICTSYKIDDAVDSEVKFSAEFQITDTRTRGTY